MAKLSSIALTIPEGFTVRDMATLVAVKGLGDRQVLLDLAFDRTFITSLGLAVASLEGYLFPDTYHVPRGIRERDLLRLMVRTLQENYTPGNCRPGSTPGAEST